MGEGDIIVAWDRGTDITVMYPDGSPTAKDDIVLFTGKEEEATKYERGFWDGRWAVRSFGQVKDEPKDKDAPLYLQGWEYGKEMEIKRWGDFLTED